MPTPAFPAAGNYAGFQVRRQQRRMVNSDVLDVVIGQSITSPGNLALPFFPRMRPKGGMRFE
jgi:hypothetical protein